MKNTQDLLKRTVLFFGIFIVVIGLCGSWIIGSKLLSQGDFWIYGDKGKLFILLTILFVFVIRKKLHELPKVIWKKIYTLYGVVTVLSLIGFFYFSSKLLAELPAKPLFYYLSSHFFLILIPTSLFFFIFGPIFPFKLIRIFKKELTLLAVIGIILYFAVFQVWKLWPFFSGIVLFSVSSLFALSFQTKVILPQTLVVETFAVQVGEACSGLESLFMFSALYGLIGYFDWKRLNKLKYFLTYIPLVIGLNIINIIRVYLIILVGVLWSEEVAIKLFHTYLGMVFFIIYFFLFLRFVYPKIKK